MTDKLQQLIADAAAADWTEADEVQAAKDAEADRARVVKKAIEAATE